MILRFRTCYFCFGLAFLVVGACSNDASNSNGKAKISKKVEQPKPAEVPESSNEDPETEVQEKVDVAPNEELEQRKQIGGGRTFERNTDLVANGEFENGFLLLGNFRDEAGEVNPAWGVASWCLGDTKFSPEKVTQNSLLMDGSRGIPCDSLSLNMDREWWASQNGILNPSVSRDPDLDAAPPNLILEATEEFQWPGNYPTAGAGLELAVNSIEDLTLRARAIPADGFENKPTQLHINFSDKSGYTLINPVKFVIDGSYKDFKFGLVEESTADVKADFSKCVRYAPEPILGACDTNEISNLTFQIVPDADSAPVNIQVAHEKVNNPNNTPILDLNIGNIFGFGVSDPDHFADFATHSVLEVEIENYESAAILPELAFELKDSEGNSTDFSSASITPGNGKFYVDFSSKLGTGTESNTNIDFSIAQTAAYTDNIFGFPILSDDKNFSGLETIRLTIQATDSSDPAKSPNLTIQLKDSNGIQSEYQGASKVIAANASETTYDFDFSSEESLWKNTTFNHMQIKGEQVGAFAGNLVGFAGFASNDFTGFEFVRVKVRNNSDESMNLRLDIVDTSGDTNVAPASNCAVPVGETFTECVFSFDHSTVDFDESSINAINLFLNPGNDGSLGNEFFDDADDTIDISEIALGTGAGGFTLDRLIAMPTVKEGWYGNGSSGQNALSSFVQGDDVVDLANIQDMVFFVNAGADGTGGNPYWSGDLKISKVQTGTGTGSGFSELNDLQMNVDWWDGNPTGSTMTITKKSLPINQIVSDEVLALSFFWNLKDSDSGAYDVASFTIKSIKQGLGTNGSFVVEKPIGLNQVWWMRSDALFAENDPAPFAKPQTENWQGKVVIDDVIRDLKEGKSLANSRLGGEAYSQTLFDSKGGIETRCKMGVENISSGVVASCFTYFDKWDVWCDKEVAKAMGYSCDNGDFFKNENFPPFEDPKGNVHWEVDIELVHNAVENNGDGKCFAHFNYYYQSWCHENETWHEIDCSYVETPHLWTIDQDTDKIRWALDKNNNGTFEESEYMRTEAFGTTEQEAGVCHSSYGPVKQPVAPVVWGGECGVTKMEDGSEMPGCEGSGYNFSYDYGAMSVRTNLWVTEQKWTFCPKDDETCVTPPLHKSAEWNGKGKKIELTQESIRVKLGD